MNRSLEQLWQELATPSGAAGDVFHPDLVADLPDPARRWLTHAIAPGTPLRDVALLRMHGTLRLRRDRPPLPMHAEQVLAPPRGFIWKARVGKGALRISGYDRYDGRGELRWRLLGVVPVARGSGPDVDRSAAGRLAGEAVLVPAAMLRHARWQEIDPTTVLAQLTVHGEVVSSTLRIADDGRLVRAIIDRWNGDERNGPRGPLPFIVDFEGERSFAGYTVPGRISAGWAAPGSEIADPFFVAELDAVDFH